MTNITIPATLVENVPFLDLEGHRYIADTGAPFSMATGGRISIGGRDFVAPETYVAGGVAKMCNEGGMQIDGLIGCDILRHFRFLVSREKGHVVIGQSVAIGHPAMTLPLEPNFPIPVVRMTVEGRKVLAAADSGASRSYAMRHVLPERRCTEVFSDYNPIAGWFTTTAQPGALAFRSTDGVELQHVSDIAILPDFLARHMSPFGIEAVLGMNVMACREVLFDIGQGIVAFALEDGQIPGARIPAGGGAALAA